MYTYSLVQSCLATLPTQMDSLNNTQTRLRGILSPKKLSVPNGNNRRMDGLEHLRKKKNYMIYMHAIMLCGNQKYISEKKTYNLREPKEIDVDGGKTYLVKPRMYEVA